MIGLIVSMIGGVLALVVALILGVSAESAFGIAAAATFGVFLALAAMTVWFYLRVQATLPVLYPTPRDDIGQTPNSGS